MPTSSEPPGLPHQSLPSRAASPLDPEHSSKGAVAVVVIFAVFGGMMLLALWLAIPREEMRLPSASRAADHAASRPQPSAPPGEKP